MKRIIIEVQWNKKEIKCCDYSEQLVECVVGWLVVVDQGKVEKRKERKKKRRNQIKQAEVVSIEKKSCINSQDIDR